MDRKVLKASEGMILTNGTVFGRTIYLAENLSESDFYEITKEKYEKAIESEDEYVKNLY